MTAPGRFWRLARAMARTLGAVGFGDALRDEAALEAPPPAALVEARAELVRARQDLADAAAWASRLEAELVLQARERDVERRGCAQTFRDLSTEVRRLRGQVSRATAEAIDAEKRREALAMELQAERRDRRSAVPVVADPPPFGAGEVADHASDTPRPSGALAPYDEVADALAPTQRPDALEERENSTTHTPGRHDGARVPEADESRGATRR